jgi:hypothetical protein
MIELTPMEKSRLRYIELYEQQMLWNSQREENQQVQNKFILWFKKLLS